MRITRMLLFLVFILTQLEIQAQMPQGFKYQTIVRDQGLAVANENIPVRLSILRDGPSGTAVYVETQNPLSSPQGVVSLIVGQGTVTSGDFSKIDWSTGSYYLQVEVNVHGSGLSLMGSSQLVSVPYALYAKSSGASQWQGDAYSLYTNGRVGIRGPVDTTGQGTDTLLFEVKSQNGEPIFQVFESGVKINVEQGSKGSKGGFVVGGRTGVKGSPVDLMRITNDSIRMYIDNGAKGSKGGFAVGGRAPGKSAAVNFVHITPENTFIGQESGISNLTGVDNVFLGNQSGYFNKDGMYNVFIGRYSGYYNTTGISNIFVGQGTGAYNTTGENNVYVGVNSGYSNDKGSQNVYLGAFAGKYANADTNIFIGYAAGYKNGTGNNNIFLGSESGENNSTGYYNVFIGTNSGLANTTGYDNIFMGHEAGTNNTTGYHNVFLGKQSGYSNISGNWNNIVGTLAGYSITSGDLNNFMGDAAGYYTTTGTSNLFLGDWSGRYNETGDQNVYLGADAGYNNVSGTGNVCLGYKAGYNETGSNKLYIANSGADNTAALVYGDFYSKILRVNGNMGINAQAYSDVSLYVETSTYAAIYAHGTIYATGSFANPSDFRLKENIVNLGSTLEKTLNLRPVSYDWKDKQQAKSMGKQIGLIAQEVELLFPQLVVTDPKGFKAMDYSRLSVILLQALKEQDQIVQKQALDIENAQKSIATLAEENKLMKQQLQKLVVMQTELDKIKNAIGIPIEK